MMEARDMKKIKFIIVMCLLSITKSVLATDNVTISGFRITRGETKEVNILLENDVAYVGFQFDLYLPEGITVASYSSDDSRIPASSSVTMNQQTDGAYRFVGAALGGEAIVGNSGSIVKLSVTASSTVAYGSKTGYFRAIKLSNAGGTGPVYPEKSFTFSVIEPSVVTITSCSRLYGEENPTFEYTVSGGALEGTPTITCPATTSSDVGDYVITGAKGSITNYNVTFINGTLTVNPAPATISITELTKTFNRAEQTPTVSVTDGTSPIASSSYTVTYNGGATLPKNAGNYTVVVTVTGNYSGTATKTFSINPKALTDNDVTLSATSFVYNKSNQKPTVTVKDGEAVLVADAEYTLTNDGGTDVGSAYPVSVVGKGNYSGTVNKSFAITPASVTISITDLTKTYNRAEQTPTVSVTDGTSPIASSSYTVTYNGGATLPKNAGNYMVVVTATGNYSGTATKTFTINPKALTDNDVTLSATSFVYNKSNQKPTVTVKDGEAVLVADAEYTLTNDGGTDVGSAYPVSVVGKGNYSGTVNKSFAITPASVTISITDLTKTYNRAEQTPTVSVTDGTSPIASSSYTVTYNGGATLPKNAGNYMVVVTATGNYSGTATKTFTINPKALTDNDVTLSATSFVYNKSNQKPTVTVKDGEAVLVADAEYTLTNDGGTDVGSAYPVSVVGKGNYSGTVNKSFAITPKDLLVKVGNYEMTEGEEVPVFVIAYEGFVGEEDENVLDELPIASTTATSLSPAGEYAIIVSGGSAKNYTFTYQNGILTIKESTGIGIIRLGSEVDVFDLRGNKVASRVKSLQGLPKGVYIVNRRKVIIK